MTARFEAHVKQFHQATTAFERQILVLEENMRILEESCRVLSIRLQRLECPEPHYSSMKGPSVPVTPNLPAIFLRKKPL